MNPPIYLFVFANSYVLSSPLNATDAVVPLRAVPSDACDDNERMKTMLKFIFMVFAVWLVGMFLVDYLEELADEYDNKPNKAETIKPVVDYQYKGKGWY